MVTSEQKGRRRRNVLAALAVVALVQLFGSARHRAPGGPLDPGPAAAAAASVRGRSVQAVAGAFVGDGSGAHSGVAGGGGGWNNSSSSDSGGIPASGQTPMLAPDALPLTVMDWADVERRNATCDAVRRLAVAHALQSADGLSPITTPPCKWAGELPRSHGALLIHNSAADWAASAATMATIGGYTDFWGQVIVAPGGSKRFVIFNNSTRLVDTARRTHDPSRLPSYLVWLPFKEFADRLRGKVTSPSLVYEGQQESLYFQGEPPEQFAVERDLARPPVSCLQDPIFPETQDVSVRKGFRIIGPRLRITAARSTHVLHYDMSPTFVVQLRGRKRVRLVAESQLPHIYPYATDHLLARRGRVDLDRPDYNQYPQSRLLQPVDLVMGPGDILMFPRSTAHTTTSLTEQISLSFRLAPNRSPPAASQPPASSTSVNGAAAQAAAKQASEQAAGQIAAQLAVVNATRAASQVTVLA